MATIESAMTDNAKLKTPYSDRFFDSQEVIFLQAEDSYSIPPLTEHPSSALNEYLQKHFYPIISAKLKEMGY